MRGRRAHRCPGLPASRPVQSARESRRHGTRGIRRRWSGSSGRSSRAARSPGSPTASSSSGSRRGAMPAGEAAFAALVARHGPMVLGVCRQLLGDHQHAEDAFQAVFLVLARKARSIRDPDLLGNWLYGVALRTARKASGRLARRRRDRGEPTAVSRPERRGRDRAGRAGGDRPRAGRGPARRDRPPAASLPPAGRALLLRGPHPRRGGPAAAMARPARSAAGWPGRARSSAAA